MNKTLLVVLLVVAEHAGAAPLACLIEPDKVAEVGAQVIGVLEKITVERGDIVKSGQVVAQLKADVERASVNVAAVRARAEADLKAASAAADFAQAKVARAQHLVSVGFISKEAADQAQAEARITQNRVAQAQEAQRLTQQELALSHTQLAQRSIRTPFAGIVVDRYRTEGERVEREPVVRIAKIDPLRIEMVLPLSQFGQVAPGATVNIRTDVTGDKLLPATVTLVDRVVDAASNTFRVRLSLPNPDQSIPSGLRCVADFGSPAMDGPKPLAASSGTFTRTAYGAATARPLTQAKAPLRLSYQLENPPSR
jgi:cobalt-zinc-cadmium efflux system membrane fusion protein